MEKTSKESAKPIFEPVAVPLKLDLKALDIVLSFVAMYLLVAIILLSL